MSVRLSIKAIDWLTGKKRSLSIAVLIQNGSQRSLHQWRSQWWWLTVNLYWSVCVCHVLTQCGILLCNAAVKSLIWSTHAINDFSLPPCPVLSSLSRENLLAHFPPTLLFYSPLPSLTIPHTPLSLSPSCHPSSPPYMWFLLSRSSFSLLIYLFTPPSLSPYLPLPLSFSGRRLIAVSQYHGGRQRGCRSSGECSTRTAGSHSNVQPWHLGQVRAEDEADADPQGTDCMFSIRLSGRGRVFLNVSGCVCREEDHTLGFSLVRTLVCL